MERFVHEQNVKLLRQALNEETDPQRRAVLEGLLAEHRGKLDRAGREARPATDATGAERQSP
jgi:hypothetical protein